MLKDSKNKLLSILSFGTMGFKSDSKNSYYAHYRLSETMGVKALDFKLKKLVIEFLGVPLHMKAIVSPLEKLIFDIDLILIKDLSKHGGCRLKKKKRK